MVTRNLLFGICLVALMLGAPRCAQAETMEAGGAFMKLVRGTTNLFTGWVEIPKRIHETSEESGGSVGFTWGLLRGLGYGFIRTAAGAYELVTFPFPAPPGYTSVIQPEYVFTTEPPERDRQY